MEKAKDKALRLEALKRALNEQRVLIEYINKIKKNTKNEESN
jgi:hypothetical protein